MVAVLPSGTKLTPARLPLHARRSGDAAQVSNTTLQNDSELLLSVAANARYRFEMQVRYSSVAAADFKWSLTVPSSATLAYSALYIPLGGSALAFTDLFHSSVGTAEAGVTFYIRMLGELSTAGTAGTLQFQWAQNTSNAGSTTVHTYSFMNLQRYE